MTDLTRIERILARLPDIAIVPPDRTLSGVWAVVIPGKQTRAFGNGDVMADELGRWRRP
jgi:hypothetical protein